jgi:SAM-dependent methyltransferase
MDITKIRSDIEAIEKNSVLYEETNFASRVEAIEYIEFSIIDRLESLLHTVNQPGELATLEKDAERVKRRLEEIDDSLFQRLRANIRLGDYTGTALKRLIGEYIRPDPGGSRKQDDIGYDNLDAFINGLLLIHALPIETKAREPEMVYYQPTPTRIILELVEKSRLTGKDVFYDLGSGLGQVPIFVNLLSGAKAKGVEFEPAYCDYARVCAAELNLSRVEFINADARTVDYSDGTVFFMYTPFGGKILRDVLEKLQRESRTRMIWIFTYGPCTPQVSRQSWLECVDPKGNHPYKLGVFRSLWYSKRRETT